MEGDTFAIEMICMIVVFIVLCFFFHIVSPPTEDIIELEDNILNAELSETLPERPAFEKDAEAFLESLEVKIAKDKDKEEPEQVIGQIKEVFPKRLNHFREWEGFRSEAFENLWRKSTKNNLKV